MTYVINKIYDSSKKGRKNESKNHKILIHEMIALFKGGM